MYFVSDLAVVLAAGAAGHWLAQRLHVPDVAIYLLLGLLLGSDALGWVRVPAESGVNQLILVFGSAYILFDGGSVVKWRVLREVWITVAVIATLGVLMTAAIVGYAAHGLIGLPIATALLLGAVIASTDPATLVPVFRQVKLRERVAQTVICESAFNDAMGAILTFSLLGLVREGGLSWTAAAGDLLWQAGGGLGIGAAAGLALSWLLAQPLAGRWPGIAALLSVIAVAGAYEAADQVKASGFMAVFVLGLISGNSSNLGLSAVPAAAHDLERFVATATLVLRVLIFVLLGSQVDLDLVRQYGLPALGVVAIFMFLARPATVFACAGPDRRARWSRNELLLMCWTRETGVIPAALAGMLLGLKLPGADVIAAVTFVAVLATILIQAPTTRWLGGKLGLLATG